MAEAKEKSNNQEEQDETKFVKTLDMDAFDVILRLYDKTFKQLVDR